MAFQDHVMESMMGLLLREGLRKGGPIEDLVFGWAKEIRNVTLVSDDDGMIL